MKSKNNIEKKLTIQLWLGVFLAIVGVVLIFLGFFSEPLAEIHNSVLIAFGEVSTFSGALIGVDYKYSYQKWRDRKLNNFNEEEDDEHIE